MSTSSTSSTANGTPSRSKRSSCAPIDLIQAAGPSSWRSSRISISGPGAPKRSDEAGGDSPAATGRGRSTRARRRSPLRPVAANAAAPNEGGRRAKRPPPRPRRRVPAGPRPTPPAPARPSDGHREHRGAHAGETIAHVREQPRRGFRPAARAAPPTARPAAPPPRPPAPPAHARRISAASRRATADCSRPPASRPVRRSSSTSDCSARRSARAHQRRLARQILERDPADVLERAVEDHRDRPAPRQLLDAAEQRLAGELGDGPRAGERAECADRSATRVE